MEPLKTVIFTGLSGAGKTTALHAVEDLGFYCVDNLPLPLLEGFFQTMSQAPGVDRVALVADARLRQSIPGYVDAHAALLARGAWVELVFLDARDDVLVRRFSQTRRRHPLSEDDLEAALATERQLLDPMRARATSYIDTTDLTVHELKQLIQERYYRPDSQLALTLLSFGYRYGLPAYADLVLDVRFLPNPYFDQALRPLTGKDPEVADFVLSQAAAREFVSHVLRLLEFLLPSFRSEGKSYLTIAIGCTGGQHRSVALAEELGARLRQLGPLRVRHRDIQRHLAGGAS